MFQFQPPQASETFLTGLELLSRAQMEAYTDVRQATETLSLARELAMKQPSVISQREHEIFVCMADAVLNSICLNRMTGTQEA